MNTARRFFTVTAMLGFGLLLAASCCRGRVRVLLDRSAPLSAPIAVKAVESNGLVLADGTTYRLAGVALPSGQETSERARGFIKAAVNQGVEILHQTNGFAILRCEPCLLGAPGLGGVKRLTYRQVVLNEMVVAYGQGTYDRNMVLPAPYAARMEKAEEYARQRGNGFWAQAKQSPAPPACNNDSSKAVIGIYDVAGTPWYEDWIHASLP